MYFRDVRIRHRRRPMALISNSTTKIAPRTSLFLLIFLVAVASQPPLVHSLSYSQFKTLVSLSHSLITRVAEIRASLGDLSGSVRARNIAEKLEFGGTGLGFLRTAWSVGWDYLKNYAWREMDYGEIYGAVSDVNELMSFVSELARAESDSERAASVARNYRSALRLSKRLLGRLLKTFSKSGALREVIKTVQIEIVEGGLLRDCLELSSRDLNSLLQILKDLASQGYSSSHHSGEL